MTEIYKITVLQTQIKINHGEIETLIKDSDVVYGKKYD